MLKAIAFVVGSAAIVLAGIGLYVVLTEDYVPSPPDPQDSPTS